MYVFVSDKVIIFVSDQLSGFVSDRTPNVCNRPVNYLLHYYEDVLFFVIDKKFGFFVSDGQ